MRTRPLRPALIFIAALLATACSKGGEGDHLPAISARRVAVMAPAAAEILDAIGASDRIVAVGDFVESPTEDGVLPRLGAFNAPNLELLVGLGIDLYVSSRSEAARGTHRRIEELGIRVLTLGFDSFDDILLSILDLGEAVGRQGEARQVAATVRRGVERVRAQTFGLPRRRVLFVVGRDPLYVAGPTSLLGELTDAAGGRVVASGDRTAYQRLSMEAALEYLPEVIIDASDNRVGAPVGRMAGRWGEWGFLPAVAADRVYLVHPDRLLIPGPRIPQAAELISRMIHPESVGPPEEGSYVRVRPASGEGGRGT